MSGIRKRFSFQLLYAFSQLVFPLITYPYVTRTIGAQGLGLIGYVEYVSGFIITIVAFGIPFYGVREAARLQDNPQQQHLLFRQLFFIHLLLSAIGALFFVGIIFINRNQNIPLPLIGLGCINILLPPFVAEWYMQGIEAFQFTTVRSIVLRFLGLIAIFLFVTSPQHYLHYYLIIIAVQAVVAITNLSKIGFQNIVGPLTDFKKHFRPLWHFFLTASIISIYVFFDVIILGWFASDAAVGYYTVAVRLVKLSLTLVLSLNVILFPRISYLITTNDVQRIQSLIQTALHFIILLTLPLAACFYFLSPQIISLLAGKNFLPSILLLRILCLLPFIIGLSNLFVYQILVPFSKEKKLLLSVFITCVCSLSLHFLLVYFFKEKGTATATLLTELTMTLLTAYFSLRVLSFSFPMRYLLQTVMALIPFVALVFLFQNFFENSWIIIFCSGVPGVMAFVLLQLFVFKNPLLKEMWESLRQRKKVIITNG